MKEELRRHMRLPLEISAEIKLANGSEGRGKTINISFGGALVEFSEPLQIRSGDHCELSMILSQGDRDMVIRFRCEAVHVGGYGVGFRFLTMDIAGYNHFKKLMTLNSPDPERLLEEIRRHPGLVLED